MDRGRKPAALQTCRTFTRLVSSLQAMMVVAATLPGAIAPRARPACHNTIGERMTYRRGIRLYTVWAWLAGGAALAGGHQAAAGTPQQAGAAWLGETGIASYYGRSHQGRRTASGRRFDKNALTAAHPWLPFGTRVRVTLAGTGRSVVVVIDDRLSARRRVIDLSAAAARKLGMLGEGVALVLLSPM
jgi:Lytic transglycolase